MKLKTKLKSAIPVALQKSMRIWRSSIEWVVLNSVISSFPSQTVRIFILRLMGAKIAKDVAVYGGNEYRNPRGLTVGKGSALGHRAILDARKGLFIGENVCFGTEVMIWTLHHSYNDYNFKTVGDSVTIGNYVWLGSRCIILPGVQIGEGAVVAAGAVVTKNVPPYKVVAGVPAKVVSERENKQYDYSPGFHRLHMV